MAKSPFRTAYLVFVWMHISASMFAHLRVLLLLFLAHIPGANNIDMAIVHEQ